MLPASAQLTTSDAVSSPLVTVVIPTYNQADTLATAVESILAQTMPDFELLLINDGSTDHTTQVIEQFHDPRIQVIHMPQNRGLVACLNEALVRGQGAYYARMDSDDWAYETRLAHQLQVFENHPDALLVGGSYNCVDAQGQIQQRLIATTDPVGSMLDLLNETGVGGNRMMAKAHALRVCGGWGADENQAEDFATSLKMARLAPIYNASHALIVYRGHDSETMRSWRSQQHKNVGKTALLQSVVYEAIYGMPLVLPEHVYLLGDISRGDVLHSCPQFAEQLNQWPVIQTAFDAFFRLMSRKRQVVLNHVPGADYKKRVIHLVGRCLHVIKLLEESGAKDLVLRAIAYLLLMQPIAVIIFVMDRFGRRFSVHGADCVVDAEWRPGMTRLVKELMVEAEFV